ILQSGNVEEFNDLMSCFVNIRIPVADIIAKGGNESNIPKIFSSYLRDKNWRETKISGDLLIRLTSRNTVGKGSVHEERIVEKFLDGHKIDYVKNRVAFDLEWNSKDQTFDRDLYAFGAFYQANII